MATQQQQRQVRVEEGVDLPIRGDYWRDVFNKVIFIKLNGFRLTACIFSLHCVD